PRWRLRPTGSRGAGRLAAQDRADPAAGLGYGRVAGRGGLGGGEGPVRGAEPERVSQRLAVLADLGAGVHVEQPHALEQFLRRARAASIASAQDAARPFPRQPSSSFGPVSTAPTRSGWSGRAASRLASSATVGPRSTGRMGAESAAPGRGRKTRPISNSAVSAKPRPMFRASPRNKPGSRVVRSRGSSSLSGFATTTAGRRMSSGGSPSRSASDRDANGDDRISTNPDSASVLPTERRSRWRGVSP